MSHKIIFFCVALVLVLFAGLIQTQHVLAIRGVIPNAVLAVLVAYAVFIPDIFFYTALALFGSSLVRFNIGFDFLAFIIFLVALISAFIVSHLPGRRVVNVIFTVILATLGVYVLSDPGFIQNHFFTVFLEMVYNCVISLCAYFAFSVTEIYVSQTIRSQSGRRRF